MKKTLIISISAALLILIVGSAAWVLAKNSDDKSVQQTTNSGQNTSQNQVNQTSGPTNNLNYVSDKETDSNLQECLDRVSKLEANDSIIKEAQQNCYDKFR